MQQYEKEHLNLVQENAAECTVLLKTDGSFPLEKTGEIAAYGAGIRYTVMGGTGSGEVNTRFSYTIEQGLEKAGFAITTKKWLDEYDLVRKEAKKAFYKELKKEAKEKHENAIMYTMGKEMREPWHELSLDGNGDAAIYVLSRNSGEGSDRTALEGDVKLAKSEVRDILALNKKYEKFMLVLNVGGVVDLSPVMEVRNILLLSQLGIDCGGVLADILLGKKNPSGKLTTTWATWEDYSSEGTFGDWNDTNYNEGIYVGYRYFDTVGKRPLFPFGYGTSYTDFEIKTDDVISKGDLFTVKVTVKNTGSFPGKEVVQTYVSLPDGKLGKAYQELASFAKSSLLKPGESQQLEMSFGLSDLASYDEENSEYILEKGDYIIRVGNSSADTEVIAVAKLDETATTLKAKNVLGDPGFKDIRIERNGTEQISSDAKVVGNGAEQVPSDVKVISISAKDIPCGKVEYGVLGEIDERVKSFTDEELSYFAIGNFDVNTKGLSIIGNAATHVAGAAGETTSQLGL
ncbi:glycoside hydrolase family 3 C-terminal domain-containing protein [Butyrivibrio sp. WCD3002]|uniref:glycoside hydrolase family 3 C-terminal domain-containing protein n=1 Tax=Butyrivibrio sp. WCD3002 TaxID=1280676 RepID=UPI0004014496|nr:glycoside hydrolase family 3 C-terminal domain-containing protein [Butyrivibrio sp. WCD3002]